ncbi:hypothetical protein MJL79_28970, partial [Salmonella enterica subsp. enterica serovar Montevideo]|nr:hypothetical protein [Salmonella enterica subsp. enterica serovar Montevideo]
KSLPSLPGEPSHQKQNMFSLLQRPGVMAGMIAIFMSFAGQFADRLVRVPLTPYQKTALATFIFNTGVTAFSKSTLLKKLNAGDY